MEELKFVSRCTLRCGSRRKNSGSGVCSTPAIARRDLGGARPGFFVCGHHARGADRLVAPDEVYRQVRIAARVSFAGISQDAELSEAEGVALLRHLVEQHGGQLLVWSVDSVAGQNSPSPAPGPLLEPGVSPE